jgi:hypothetical protein
VHAYASESKDATRSIVYLTLICTALTALAVLVLFVAGNVVTSEVTPPAWFLGAFGPPGFTGLFQIAYRGVWNRWIWRMPLVHQRLGLPDIDGLWKGRVEPCPASGIGAGDVVLKIDQRWLGISVHFVARLDADPNGRVVSNSSMAAFVHDGADLDFRYEYEIRPDGSVAIHLGVAHLYLRGEELRPTALSGFYYTDKNGDPQHFGQLKDFHKLATKRMTLDEAFAASA